MKIIEAMKKTSDLQRKASDLHDKIQRYCADYTHETPKYGDRQREQIDEWLQAHNDVVKEILRLKIAIQRTNLATQVSIELGGKTVTKSIAEWIIRRRELAEVQLKCWQSVGDRGLTEGYAMMSSGEKQVVKIRRYYDPKQRDEMVELYRSEPSIINGTLEVVNAVTDLLEN